MLFPGTPSYPVDGSVIDVGLAPPVGTAWHYVNKVPLSSLTSFDKWKRLENFQIALSGGNYDKWRVSGTQRMPTWRCSNSYSCQAVVRFVTHCH